MALGPKVRDLKMTKARAYQEETEKAIAEYLKWALQDGKINSPGPSCRKLSLRSLDKIAASCAMAESSPIFPMVVIHTAPVSASMEEIEAALLEKLDKLGEYWIEYTSDGDEFPTLYGIICTWAIVGLASYDLTVDDEGKRSTTLRTISTFQYSERGHDVWNALRLAIFGNHLRNEMMRVRDLRGYGYLIDEGGSDRDCDF
jgi:hypothetical protein